MVSDRYTIRVAAFIAQDESLLMVRQAKDGRDYWLLPGGNLETGESLEEGLKRELMEECGVRVAVKEPLLLIESIDPEGSRHIVHITFRAELQEPLRADHADVEGDILETRYISGDELSDLDIRPPFGSELIEILAGGSPACRSLGPRWS